MMQKKNYEEILSRTFKTFVSSTCAEAVLQGLQEIWDLQLGKDSWATAGYSGAIGSGDTTCGLLIGSSVAIGMRAGRDKTCLPLDDKDARNKAIADVSALYKDFLEKFGTTQCEKLIQCNFSKSKEATRYIKEKIYENRCFKFLDFVMNRFIEMEKSRSCLYL
jgi:C_GCAxxG_C_C family probable redox protein